MTDKDIFNIAEKDTLDEIFNRLNLTDLQKDIFVLRYYRGWVMADIAAEVDRSRSTVSKELTIIRRKLAQL